MSDYVYHPSEIVDALCDHFTGITQEMRYDCEDMVYHIHACAANPYNKDYWRTFYNILSMIADEFGS